MNSENFEKVDKIKQIFNDLFSELNHMGNEDNVRQALGEVLKEQHRTLQQLYFRHVIVPSIDAFAQKKDHNFTDLRNEASCELAHKLRPLVKDSCLPFI